MAVVDAPLHLSTNDRSHLVADRDTLAVALEQVTGRPIVDVTCRRSPYTSGAPIDDIDVLFSDGDRIELVRKDLAWHALLPEAALTKPKALHDPMREIGVYRRIVDLVPSGPPRLVGAVTDVRSSRWWLFIERINGVELYQVGSLPVWEAVARWLGEFHRQTSGLTTAAAGAPLLQLDQRWYRAFLDRALAFADGAPRRALQHVKTRFDAVVDCLESMPRSMVHGELYASNVLVVETARDVRVCPVDWEMAAIGPGVVDVAALTTGWPDDATRRLLAAYSSHGPAISSTQLFDGVCAARAHLAVRWLGWSRHWLAPPEHSRDWAAEAVQMVEAL